MHDKLKLCESLIRDLCAVCQELLNSAPGLKALERKPELAGKLSAAKEKKELLLQEISHIGKMHREILDTGSDVIMLTDLNGRLLYVAGNTKKLLGYTAGALKKMGDLPTFFREPVFVSPIPPLNREIKNQEIEIRLKPGESRFLLLNIKKAKLDSGTMIYSLQDITGLKSTEKELIKYRDYLEQLVEERTAVLKQENAERRKTEKQLKESEGRYRNLFENSPISLWEEDYCKAKQYMNQLKERGVKDLRRYFDQNPGELAKCVQLIKIIEVNDATLKLFKTENRQTFLKSLKKFFLQESYDFFKEELLAIDEGKNLFEGETVNKTAQGEKIYIAIKVLCPKYPASSCHHAVVSLIDLTQRKQIEEETRKSREKYQALSAHLENAREQERKRIAREIHDELGQTLTALKIDLFWLKQKLPQGEHQLLAKINYMSKIIDFSLNAMQRISSQLRPEILDQLGLIPAIQWYVEKFLEYTYIKVQLDIEPFRETLKPEMATAVFRIFQEAITNVARHARATKVKIALKVQNHSLELTVSDNGQGITPEQINTPESFGLMGIQERVRTWNGKFNIAGTPRQGTTLQVIIPIAERETNPT